MNTKPVGASVDRVGAVVRRCSSAGSSAAIFAGDNPKMSRGYRKTGQRATNSLVKLFLERTGGEGFMLQIS
jgi:hypothetical protein